MVRMYLQSEFHIQWLDYWVQLQAVVAAPSCNNSQNQLESIGKPPGRKSVDPHVSVPIPRNSQPSGQWRHWAEISVNTFINGSVALTAAACEQPNGCMIACQVTNILHGFSAFSLSNSWHSSTSNSWHNHILSHNSLYWPTPQWWSERALPLPRELLYNLPVLW